MKLLVEQKYFILADYHDKTLQGAFTWWLTRKNKQCRKFCPTCQYYFRCQEVVELAKIKGGKNNVRNGY